MTKTLSVFAVSVLTCLISGNVYAQYCPTKIAAISGDPLSEGGANVLRQIYGKLGCTPEVTFLPGRRGVNHFNKSAVDGELYRLRLIESQYKTAFVRSSTPVFSLTNALWVHPSPAIAEKKRTAYVLGIAWHEKFVVALPVEQRAKYVKYHSDGQVFAAYNRGAIGSFLTEKQSIDILLKKNAIRPIPVLKKVISSLPLYHYLGKRYAKFMADFSAELARDNPFSKLE